MISGCSIERKCWGLLTSDIDERQKDGDAGGKDGCVDGNLALVVDFAEPSGERKALLNKHKISLLSVREKVVLFEFTHPIARKGEQIARDSGEVDDVRSNVDQEDENQQDCNPGK